MFTVAELILLCKPRELQCTTVSKRLRDGFTRHLSAILFFKCDEMS